jgi:hypothetical protein
MDGTMIQGLMWMGAFGIMFTLMRRRRARRTH